MAERHERFSDEVLERAEHVASNGSYGDLKEFALEGGYNYSSLRGALYSKRTGKRRKEKIKPLPIEGGWDGRFPERLLGFQKLLTSCALGFTQGNFHDAEDLVQETMLTALDYREQFVNYDERSLRDWLFTVMRNISLAQKRKKERRDRLQDDLVMRVYDETPLITDQNAHSDFEDVKTCLSALEVGQQETIVLSAIGYSYDEISKAQSVAYGTVQSRMYRAREKLKILTDFAK